MCSRCTHGWSWSCRAVRLCGRGGGEAGPGPADQRERAGTCPPDFLLHPLSAAQPKEQCRNQEKTLLFFLLNLVFSLSLEQRGLF